MISGTLSDTQRIGAKIAGLAFPISFILVVVTNFAILGPVLISGDPAASAQSILAHETQFRLGILGNILYCVGVVALSAALYVILKPAGANLALMAAISRLIHGLTWLLVAANLFSALRLLSRAQYASAFDTEQLSALALLYLSGLDQYYIGLIFWALAGILGGILWLKSGYVPRALAIVAIIASAWCALCTLIYTVFPGFADTVNLWWFDIPLVLGEMALSVWLLIKGLKPAA